MVRGRRARPVVTCTNGANACCDSPKRKDQRLDYQRKVQRVVVSPSRGVRAHTITEFFQIVNVEECNLTEQQNGFEKVDCCDVPKNGFIGTPEPKSNGEIPNGVSENFKITPHRIELHSESPKRTGPAKARRRLNANHKVTEYFPVRRSNRKTKRTVLEEKQYNLEECVRKGVEDGLKVEKFEDKGRGVVTTRKFLRGDFVVEYSGKLLIGTAEAKQKEEDYSLDHNKGCYMYYFKYKNVQYCIDATEETGRLGRLVNHSRNGNLITKIISVDGLPHLVLIARDDIAEGEEIMYDYGDRSKESLKYHPWLAT